MNKTRQKMHSKSGATMIMALVLLLTATMVSGVLISAAITAMRNAVYQKEIQQTYLCVSSAAEYVYSELNDKELVQKYLLAGEEIGAEELETIEENGLEACGINLDEPDIKGTMTNSDFWPMMESFWERIQDDQSGAVTFYLQLTGGANDDELKAVTSPKLEDGQKNSGALLPVECKVQAVPNASGTECTITAEFHMANAGESDPDCYMYIELHGYIEKEMNDAIKNSGIDTATLTEEQKRLCTKLNFVVRDGAFGKGRAS